MRRDDLQHAVAEAKRFLDRAERALSAEVEGECARNGHLITVSMMRHRFPEAFGGESDD